METSWRNPKRSRFEINIEILNYCRTPKVKTRVMSAVNVAFTPFNAASKELIEKGLLKIIPAPNLATRANQKPRVNRRLVGLFVITDKGFKLLKSVEPAMKLLGVETR